jgi:hypothetical protein
MVLCSGLVHQYKGWQCQWGLGFTDLGHGVENNLDPCNSLESPGLLSSLSLDPMAFGKGLWDPAGLALVSSQSELWSFFVAKGFALLSREEGALAVSQ